MADSSSPVDTTPGDVASSRYAGAAQVLGYDQKQADWVAGREELIRVREARVRRRKQLILAGRITAWLTVIAVVLGLLIAGVSWLANVSHEANERAKAEASISASMSPSPTVTSTSPTPSPTPTEKCLSHEERGDNTESEYCKAQEGKGHARSLVQLVIMLIVFFLLFTVVRARFQIGSMGGTLIGMVIALVVGVILMALTNLLI